MDLIEKQKSFKKLAQEYKKKRIVLDEHKASFGFDKLVPLKKVTNITSVKGYPFKLYNKEDNFKLGLKVIPLEKEYNREQHPGNLELIFLKYLSNYTQTLSPHIVQYIHSQKISNRSLAIKHLNLKRLELEDTIRSQSLILVSQFIEGESLYDFIKNNDRELTLVEWKQIIFGIVYTLHVLQLNFKFNHNDCHYGNVLIDKYKAEPDAFFVYKTCNKEYYLKSQGYISMIWDLEYSMSYNKVIPNNYPNAFIVADCELKDGVYQELDSDNAGSRPLNFNKYYDLHFFLTSLLELVIPQEIFDWILSIYPIEVIPEDSDSDSETDESDSETDESDSETDDSETDSTDYSDSEDENSESWESETDRSEDSDYTTRNMYLEDKQLINGVEKLFKLPTPQDILESDFFAEFLIQPKNIDKEKSMFFNERI
jgi:hypothetical protein